MPGGPYRARIKHVSTGTGHNTTPNITTPATLSVIQGSGLIYPVTATGTPTPTLAVQSGTLPPGVTFTPGTGSGTFVGTPSTTSGSPFSVTIRATNSAGHDDQVFTITVNPLVVVPDPTIYEVPASIDHTGATDVTDTLQAFINSVPNGTSTTPNVIRFLAGTYRVEGRIWLGRLAHGYTPTPIKNYTVFDGSLGTTITRSLAGAGQPDVLNNDFFTVQQGAGVVFYGLEINGGNPMTNGYAADDSYVKSLETQNGIRFMGHLGGEVSNCEIHHTYGDAVYMGFGNTLAVGNRLSQNIWVHDNEFHHNGRQGVSPCGINHCVVESNYFHEERRAAIDMEPIGAPASQGGPNPNVFAVYDCHLLSNQLDSVNLSVFANKGSGLCDTIVIADNTTTDTKLDTYFGSSNYNNGDPGAQRYNLWFMRNTFNVVSMAWPIHCQRYDGMMFKDNVVKQQARQWASEDGVHHPVDPWDVAHQSNPVIYDKNTNPTGPHHIPPWLTDTQIPAPFVETNFCRNVTVTGNTHTPSTGIQVYNSSYTSGGTPLSTTEPAAPDVGAAYALRSTGGWVPS